MKMFSITTDETEPATHIVVMVHDTVEELGEFARTDDEGNPDDAQLSLNIVDDQDDIYTAFYMDTQSSDDKPLEVVLHFAAGRIDLPVIVLAASHAALEIASHAVDEDDAEGFLDLVPVVTSGLTVELLGSFPELGN